MLSEDRKAEGLLPRRSIADNLTITRMEPVAPLGFVSVRRLRRIAERLVALLGVRMTSVFDPIETLSGGNQQKVALGRLLHHDAEVLLLDEPTRGVDVGSKAEIYRLIRDQAAAGKGVLLVSSYLPELLGVCDTIAVMCRGRLVASRPVRDWTEHDLLRAALGDGPPS
jgi:ribose transport system ATP-binding protein